MEWFAPYMMMMMLCQRRICLLSMSTCFLFPSDAHTESTRYEKESKVEPAILDRYTGGEEVLESLSNDKNWTTYSFL
jgi:hypothetical protein